MNDIDLQRLKDQAIETAVSGNYEAAIELNQKILAECSEDSDALMQLAHAYWQTGELKNAEKYYQKTLIIEPENTLAKNRLALLKTLVRKAADKLKRTKARIISLADFIEEPGKTKVVRLSNIGKPEHINLLSIGEEVFFGIRRRKLSLRDINNNYVGCLPDDISKRLIEFINHKSKYEAFIFLIDRNDVRVFIQEVKKGLKFRNLSSFMSDDIQPRIKLDDIENAELVLEEADKKAQVDESEEEDLLTPEQMLEKETQEDKETEDEDSEIYQEYEE